MQTKATSKNSMQSFEIVSGLNVHIADFVPAQTIHQRFATVGTTLRFCFYIFGRGYWDLSSPYHPRSQSQVIQGDRISSLSYYPQMEGRIHLPMACRQLHLSLSITPSRLKAYLGDRLDDFPQEVRDISDGRMDKGYAHAGPLSRMMCQAVQDLMDCPYTGRLKALYLESKAMELIAHKLAQTARQDDDRSMSPKLGRRDMDRVLHAREILCRDMHNPPTLSELAHAVGTNHCRLNTGFRELFGATVFAYLRQRRLIEARRLIVEEGLNITEAAFHVGYNSLSSFSKAFSEHFGLSPIRLRKRSGQFNFRATGWKNIS